MEHQAILTAFLSSFSFSFVMRALLLIKFSKQNFDFSAFLITTGNCHLHFKRIHKIIASTWKRLPNIFVSTSRCNLCGIFFYHICKYQTLVTVHFVISFVLSLSSLCFPSLSISLSLALPLSFSFILFFVLYTFSGTLHSLHLPIHGNLLKTLSTSF